MPIILWSWVKLWIGDIPCLSFMEMTLYTSKFGSYSRGCKPQAILWPRHIQRNTWVNISIVQVKLLFLTEFIFNKYKCLWGTLMNKSFPGLLIITSYHGPRLGTGLVPDGTISHISRLCSISEISSSGEEWFFTCKENLTVVWFPFLLSERTSLLLTAIFLFPLHPYTAWTKSGLLGYHSSFKQLFVFLYTQGCSIDLPSWSYGSLILFMAPFKT